MEEIRSTDPFAGECLLRHHGLRATPQRVVVVKALEQLEHPHAEAIFQYAAARYSSLSFATVYNILDKLTTVGLIAAFDLGGRRYYDRRTERHDHIRCGRCGTLSDVSRPSHTHLVDPILDGWAVWDHSLVWHGLCPTCQEDEHHG